MRRLLPHPVLSPVLAVVWLLLVNDLSVGQVLLGTFLGWFIPLFSLRFWPDPVRVRKPLILLRFFAVMLWDILVANLVVARLILGRPERLRPAFVEIPLQLRSDLAISLLANTITLTPGTLSAELAADRRTLVVHCLDAPDPAAVVASIRERYETPLREVFETC